jgi:hypothetical protein
MVPGPHGFNVTHKLGQKKTLQPALETSVKKRNHL